MKRALAAALAVLATGCSNGQLGTLQVELTAAPGSTVLDSVTRLRMTITAPRQVVEAVRSEHGFELALEVEASGATGAIVIEGFDANDLLIATGQSPPFGVTGFDARIVIYVAPPLSIGASPSSLAAPRTQIAGAALRHGAIFAGGTDATGAPTSSIAVYNAYDHSVTEGVPLLAARAGMAIGAGTGGNVFLFGGRDSGGNPTGTLWMFATSVEPAGAYSELGDYTGSARADQIAVPLGNDRFLITGAPPLELEGNALIDRSEQAAVPATGASVIAADGVGTAIFAGPDGIVRFRDDAFDELGGSWADAAATALPLGRVAIVGGGPPAGLSLDMLVVEAASGEITTRPNALSTARRRPAIAATSRHLVIAGGLDVNGLAIATADVLDARTLERLATIPLAPRSATVAIALPNDQIAIASGDAPTELVELFTPPPPPLE